MEGKTNGKTKCPKLKKSAFQVGPKDQADLPQTQKYGKDHFKEFMALIESGAFDGKTVYIGEDNPIMRGLLRTTPASHWKTFQQRSVLQGWQQDKGLDPKLQKPGMPQLLIDIETVTGHKFTIHVIKEPPKKAAPTGNPQL